MYKPTQNADSTPVGSSRDVGLRQSSRTGGEWTPPTRVAFVIGVGEYDDPSIDSLPFAVNDAKAFYDIMVDPCIGAADPDRSSLLLNPTQDRVLDELRYCLARGSPEDEVVVYVAGHAERLPSDDLILFCRDTDDLRMYGVRYGELQRQLRESSAQGNIVILDTCFARSAALLKDQFRTRGSVRDLSLVPPRGSAIIWACGSSELTIEDTRSTSHGLLRQLSRLTWRTRASAAPRAGRDGPGQSAGHGVFTRLLLDALKNGANQDSSVEYVTPSQAITFVRDELKKSHFAEKFWPGCRVDGELPLRLARNPHFEHDAAGADAESHEAGVTRARLRHIANTLGLAEASEHDQLQRLRAMGEELASGTLTLEPSNLPSSAASVFRRTASGLKFPVSVQKFLHYAPHYQTDICLLLAPDLRLSKTAILLRALFVGFVLFMMLGIPLSPLFDVVPDESPLWMALVGIPLLGSVVYAAWELRVTARASATRFLLTSREGFVYSAGLGAATSALWSSVDIKDYTTGDGEVQTEVRMRDLPKLMGILIRPTCTVELKSAEPDASTRIVFRGGVNGDNLHHVQGALLWGQEAADARLAIEKLSAAAPAAAAGETAETGPSSNRFALFGVGDYEYQTPLTGPRGDVEALHSLVGPRVACTAVIDPNSEEFTQAISLAFREATHRVLVMYFAGHGIVKGGNLYLAARDTHLDDLHRTAFPVARLFDLVHTAHLRHLVLVLDCCFSGTAREDLGLVASASVAKLFDAHLDAITVFAAARPHEVAYESHGRGQFSRRLTEQMKVLIDERDVFNVDDLRLRLIQQDPDGKQLCQINASQTGLKTVLVGETSISREAGSLKERIAEQVTRDREQISSLANELSPRGVDGPLADWLTVSARPRAIRWWRRIFIVAFALGALALLVSIEGMPSSGWGAWVLGAILVAAALRDAQMKGAFRRNVDRLSLSVGPTGVLLEAGVERLARSWNEIERAVYVVEVSSNGTTTTTFVPRRGEPGPSVPRGSYFNRVGEELRLEMYGGEVVFDWIQGPDQWPVPLYDIGAAINRLLDVHHARDGDRAKSHRTELSAEERAELIGVIHELRETLGMPSPARG